MKRQVGSYERCFKRILDFLFSLTALVCFGWLMLLIAALVRICLGSPVLFRQPRPGKDEAIFYLYKFRTMTDARDLEGHLLPDEQRLTKFGKWLRGTSLDELPQLWSILCGKMSLIGPRPQLVRDMVFMSERQRRRHEVKPGLTGLAQVSGRNALEWDHKLEKDLEYVDHINFCTDVKIFFKTIQQVIFCRKGHGEASVGEVDLTDDFGVYLLKNGKITREQFEAGLRLAEQILAEEGEKPKA